MIIVILVGALLEFAGAGTMMARIRQYAGADKSLRQAVGPILLVLGAVLLAIGLLGFT
jgi:hypothetical protein